MVRESLKNNISDPSLDGTKEDQHSSDNSDSSDPRSDVERKDIEFLVLIIIINRTMMTSVGSGGAETISFDFFHH